MLNNKKPTTRKRDSTDALYSILDSIRKIEDEEERQEKLIYLTGVAAGLAASVSNKEE